MSIIVNRKAKFQYYLLDFYLAGIQLLGSEVKSIRNRKINISESFCQIINKEMYIINLYIEKYKFGSNCDTRRKRKLLLNKKELIKINKKLVIHRMTIVPIEIFFNKKGFIKVKIAIAKGKKNYDKREIKKNKELIKEINQY
ncbi:SsrA-binding protein SmpB [Blattabacterium cuenoti]|uniref:SsrA-binding protein SmpB n=1 Tax=Blattabacterium cuenoti TaxID=1653831 RepID=UPI00163B6693|nr:SsrA-binding protein SmpB [Blattabacterium cuenoti]